MRQSSPTATPPLGYPYSSPDYSSAWQEGSDYAHKNDQFDHRLPLHSKEEESELGAVKGRVLRGALLLREGRVKQAGAVLKECEEALEEAGDRGEEVEEGVVLTLLHNLAFFYQLEWDLSNCSTYLEAITYNLNRRLSRHKKQSTAIKHLLSQYWLVSCGVSSQMTQHEAALLAARRVNELVRESVSEESSVEGSSEMLRDFTSLPGNVQRRQVEQLRETAMCLLSVWVNKCSFPNRHLASVIDRYKNYTIANAMHLEPLQKIVDHIPDAQITNQTVIDRAVLLSMSYFTIATELRLICKQRENSFYQQQEENGQWVQSQCYHLLSIIAVTHLVPFDLAYLQNILTSYSTHYQHQLSRQHYSSLTPSQMIQALSPVPESPPNQQDLQLETYCQASKEYARLNQYYYNSSKSKHKELSKNRKNGKMNKSKKSTNKRGCVTSQHSTQKTPIGRSPRNLSPHRQRLIQGQRSQKAVSQRQSILKPPTKTHKKEVKLNGDYELGSHQKGRPHHMGSKQNQNGVRSRGVGSPSYKTTSRNPSQATTRTLKSVSSAGQLGKALASRALRR